MITYVWTYTFMLSLFWLHASTHKLWREILHRAVPHKSSLMANNVVTCSCFLCKMFYWYHLRNLLRYLLPTTTTTTTIYWKYTYYFAETQWKVVCDGPYSLRGYDLIRVPRKKKNMMIWNAIIWSAINCPLLCDSKIVKYCPGYLFCCMLHVTGYLVLSKQISRVYARQTIFMMKWTPNRTGTCFVVYMVNRCRAIALSC